MTNPLDGYPERTWKTYPVSFGPEMDSLPTEGVGNDFLQCSYESPLVAPLAEQDSYDPTTMFFPDWEQINAGHNVHGTGLLMRLTDEYRGHPAGRLAFVSYEGLEDEPPTYLLYVEV